MFTLLLSLKELSDLCQDGAWPVVDDELLDEQLAADDSDAQTALVLKELTFPFSAKEPDLPQDEMTRLDALADQLELMRLQKLQVLQSPETVPGDPKVLSTRFVRTWREKHNEKGEAVW